MACMVVTRRHECIINALIEHPALDLLCLSDILSVTQDTLGLCGIATSQTDGEVVLGSCSDVSKCNSTPCAGIHGVYLLLECSYDCRMVSRRVQGPWATVKTRPAVEIQEKSAHARWLARNFGIHPSTLLLLLRCSFHLFLSLLYIDLQAPSGHLLHALLHRCPDCKVLS